MKKLTALILGTALLAVPACKDKTDNSNVKTEPAIASASDIGRRIAKLSSDEFEGRAPSTPGGIAASQYIADEMKAIGLEPMGANGTYFQPVALTETVALPTSALSISKGGEALLDADQSTNAVFWTKRLKPSVSVTDSDVVFVGYGVVAPEFGWDDYAGLDVKGKTVVMLVNDPGFGSQDDALFKGNAMTYYGRWTYKYEEAGRQGAAAVLVVHETAPASYPWEVVSGGWSGAQYDLVRPDGGASRSTIEGWLHYDTAKSLFAAAGQDYDALKVKAHAKGFKPVPLEGLKLSATINQDVKQTQSRNVAGAVTGTKHPDEYVLYMGHWDHLGIDKTKEGDQIFNGAVDNATGTSLILEIAEAFVQQGAPERSAIFVAVTAEESGLLGSAYYGADPIVPLNKTVAGINIDGVLPVGETKDMIVVGYGSSELEDRLQAIIEPRGMYITPDPKPEAGYYYRSDHISLGKLGVPMLYSDSGVDHVINGRSYGEALAEEYTKERYHKAGDEYDNSWDLSGMENLAEILFELGYGIADSSDWPNWYEGTEFRALRDTMMQE
ncbi:MAG: M28 family metallopeptidase [Alphaproteobacteria bacterium]